MKKLSLALVAAAALSAVASPAAAQRAGEESTTTTYVGYYGVDEGYDDRLVVGNFTNLYSGAFGVHTDFAHVRREQNGTFGAAGLSYALGEKVRVKAMAGTSDNDGRDILPELYLSGSAALTVSKGLIVTPDVTFRRYRNGGREISPGVAVAKYFNLAGDTGGYYVAQGDASVSFIKDTDERGYQVGGAISTVRKSGITVGLNFNGGKMAYDTITGLGRLPVRSNTLGGGASLGYRFAPKSEIFVRGNVSANDYFWVHGGMLGLKFGL
jgi:hypothetical protein